MELQFKQKVTEALNKWLDESNSRTLNGFCKEHDITVLYASKIKNGVYEVVHNDKSKPNTVIADEYFYRIAEAIGLMTRSHTGFHWNTYNFRRVTSLCKASQNKRMR